MTRFKFNSKNVLSFFILLLFIFLAYGSEESEESKNERIRKQEIRNELLEIFQFSSPYVNTYSEGSGFFSEAYIKIKNNSDFKFQNVSVFLNPPQDDLEGLFDGITQGVFRAPGNKEKVYSIRSNDYIKIRLSEFIHTKSNEKFDLDRYRLDDYVVIADVEYNGENVNFRQVYTFTP